MGEVERAEMVETHSVLGTRIGVETGTNSIPLWRVAARAPSVMLALAGSLRQLHTNSASRPGRAADCAPADRKLLQRILHRFHPSILEASAFSRVPPEFLAALTANESGGDPWVSRFEPDAYRYLEALAADESGVHGSFRPSDPNREGSKMCRAQTNAFHRFYLTPQYGANHRREIARLGDEARAELATSWGPTQIMGYHVVGGKGSVADLLDPQFHYRLAVGLLSDFAGTYQLDVASEFEEMFRCWKTGRPYGKTADPAYVANGVRRMIAYRELAATSIAQDHRLQISDYESWVPNQRAG